MTLVKLALVFIGVGVFFMVLALLKTRETLGVLKGKIESKSWRVLFFMILFFLAGYVFSIYFILQNQHEFLILLTGIVFLFGALFVFIVTRISFFTINALLFNDKTKELNKELVEERKQLENRVESRTSELMVLNIKLQSEIEENRKAQHELAESKNRLERQNHTLHILTKKLNVGNDNLTKHIHELTEIASETIETERVSIWLYDELKTSIKCIDLYERSKKKHSEGEKLNAENYPIYFKAIELDRVIDASDACNDLRTYEYFETYLKPLGITSLLDAPIRKGGIMIGIICFEQGGSQRIWTIDEQLFAGAIADSVSILLESIERIKAEKAFQEKEQLLSSIYDTVGDIIFVLSVEKEERYKFVSINKTFVTTTGLSYDQVVGKYVDEIIPQPSLKFVLEKYKKAILDKKIVRWEEVSDYPTGKLIGEVNIVPIFDEKGNSTLMVGAVHDITDRKKAEDKIRKMSQELEKLVKERTASLTLAQESLKFSEEKYRKIVEEAGDVVYSSDHKGYFTYINPMSKKITGYTENELIGKHFTEIIDPEWKDAVVKFYKDQFDNKIRETLFSFPIIAKTGEKKWVEQTVIQQRDGDKITGHQAILRDITHRKEIEEEIKQKSEELVRSNQELEQFAYVASHDLQEPLRTISNFVGLLEKTQCGTIDDDAKKYLNFITSATSRMQNLIKDLLDYSRVGKGITFSIVDCNSIFKEVLSGMDASIKESHAKITTDVLPKVIASDIQLKQLFQNLISNAIKFRKKNSVPDIKITVEDKPAEYLFAVKDNGIGIEEKHLNKLFVLFQRLHAEAEYPGTGIGLAICKKIVTLHGGKIWAESKLGEGSIFYFTLPKKNLFS